MCGLVLTVAVAAGCNQADPSDDEGAGEVFVPMGEGERVSHFPLVDGGMWTYVATEGGAQAFLAFIFHICRVKFSVKENVQTFIAVVDE